jgi:hypothetical protein
VYLAYASSAGHGVIDRELYLPRSWTDNPSRCRAAGIPDQVGFATKPHLATKMLPRALDVGVPAAWVTATRSTAPARPCGPSLRRAGSATCWRSPAPTASGQAVQPTVPTPCATGSRPGHGSRSRAARAPGATATTTGRLCASTTATPILAAKQATRQASTGSCSAATSAPVSWPSTAASRLARCRWPSWSTSPGPGGRWRCVNHSALIYADWLGDLGSRCGLVVLSRPSVGGCTSQVGGIGAGGVRRAGGDRRE